MPAFKKRKINAALAAQLATAIAHKSFEHEEAALLERRITLSMSAYAEMFGVKSFTAAVALVRADIPRWALVDLQPEHSHSHYFKLANSAMPGFSFDLKFNEPVPLIECGRTAPVSSPVLADAMLKLEGDHRVMSARRQGLIKELARLVTLCGDTHQVAKSWPEVEPMLADMFAVETAVHVPALGVTLGQFLAVPAIPFTPEETL